ncbi:MAG: ABC transporter permease, partial [Acidobacteriota bacterium]
PAGPSALSGRAGAYAVNDDYFAAFGLDIVRGRGFGERDSPGSAPVAVLNQRAAAILAEGGDPIGLEIRFPGAELWFTVVGVVEDRVRIASGSYDRSEFGMRAEAWPEVYFSAAQLEASPNNLMWVRPVPGVSSLQALVRDAVAAVDSRLPLSELRSVWESDYEPHQFIYRVAGQALGGLGAITLLLSALGTYSVIAYTWSRRTREVGVRMAFGATASEVFRLVLAHTQKLALTGILLGALLSLALYRIADSLFFDVRSWDPITYVTLAILLSAIAAAAGLSPAQRATRTDPAEVLRHE